MMSNSEQKSQTFMVTLSVLTYVRNNRILTLTLRYVTATSLKTFVCSVAVVNFNV
jgi:hypothetical protein